MPSAHPENALGTFAAALGFDSFHVAWDLAKSDFESDADVAELAHWLSTDTGAH